MSGDLLSHHAKLIADSSVNADVAAARGYESVTTKARLATVGFGASQRSVPTLLLPVWGVNGEIQTYQHRPDHPRIVKGSPLKYETPTGSRLAVDVHPFARPWIGDPSRPLIITEGVRKADAAVSRGLCAVALLGVWNWRGTNEWGGKALLPDWESIAVNGRKVYIAFDSDVMEKREVYQALSRAQGFLSHRDASVRLIYLPSGDGGKKVGLDDFLAAGHSVDDLLALATSELRPPPDDGRELQAPYRATLGGLVHVRGDQETHLTNFTAKIVADVAEDDGTEISRVLEIEANLKGRATTFTIGASAFSQMNWPVEKLGASAIVFAGQGARDHARVAIQTLSPDIAEKIVYTHTGWREIDGQWAYLAPSGPIGPIGPISTQVALNMGGVSISLPDPPSGADLVTAVRASMKLLDVAPRRITVPLFGAIWRAAFDRTDFTIQLSGGTGVGKSELAALAQQHWGAGFDARHLPGSWASTANALEGLAFTAKDMLLVVDDFAPTGSQSDVQRMHKDADRLLRAQGNASGRQRMRADATLRPTKPPRGTILSTGEDIPAGQSLRARMAVLEVGPRDVNWGLLTQCQAEAAEGLYAAAMAGFLQWLAENYPFRLAAMRKRALELRQEASGSSAHRRTPDITGNIGAGLAYFLIFAIKAGAVEKDEGGRIWSEWWASLGETAATQHRHQAASEPTRRFLDLLLGAIGSGDAHVATTTGDAPSYNLEGARAWGWRERVIGSGDNERVEWDPRGKRIGWIEDGDLYLEPEAAFAVAQRLGRDNGDGMVIQPKTLAKRLADRGLLVSTETEGGHLTVRKILEGRRRRVLHMAAESLCDTHTVEVPGSPMNKSVQSVQPGQRQPEATESVNERPAAWAESPVEESVHKIPESVQSVQDEPKSAGSTASLRPCVTPGCEGKPANRWAACCPECVARRDVIGVNGGKPA